MGSIDMGTIGNYIQGKATEDEIILINSVEDRIQKALVGRIRREYPFLILFHSPNGGRRSAREAAAFKAMGVLKGLPDLGIARASKGYHGMYMELKKKGGRLSVHQCDIIQGLKEEGYYVVTCDNIKEAYNEITGYIKNEE